MKDRFQNEQLNGTSKPKSVFISYSSKDKIFVSRLAKDLSQLGVKVWLDDWEIEVGDNIIQRINSGLQENQYLVIVLSSNSIASQWVQEELSARLADDFSNRRVTVLPVLIDECKVPPLLRSKKFADFRTDYYFGFKALSKKILGQSLDLYERRSWSRSFLGYSINRSYGSAFFIALFITAFYYMLSAELSAATNAQDNLIKISKYLLYSNSILSGIFSLLWILDIFISSKKVYSVQLHHQTEKVISPAVSKNIQNDSNKPSIFITEHVEIREASLLDAPSQRSVKITILFSLWNRNPTKRIKVYDIKTKLYGTLANVQYLGGPRTLVIIDEDSSFINQNETVEIPPEESASFNLLYRVSTNHGEFVVFGLVIYYHDDSGEKKEINSDCIYAYMNDKIIAINRSNYPNVLREYGSGKSLLEKAFSKHFVLP